MAVEHPCLPPRLARFNVFDLLCICGFPEASITSGLHLVKIMVSWYMLHVFLSFFFFLLYFKHLSFWIV